MTNNIFDLIAQEEERLLAAERAKIAAEKAAYEALSDGEKAAIHAAYKAKYANLDDAVDAEEEDEEDEDDWYEGEED